MTKIVKLDGSKVAMGYGLVASDLIQISQILSTLREADEEGEVPQKITDQMNNLIGKVEAALQGAAEKASGKTPHLGIKKSDRVKADAIFEALEEAVRRSFGHKSTCNLADFDECDESLFQAKRYLTHKLVWSATCDNELAEQAAKLVD